MQTKYDKHGALHVNADGKLVDHNGSIVQLKGYSTHGLSWYPQYVNREFFAFMRDNWNIDIVRLAMYTAEEDGYCVGTEENKEKLLEVIDQGVRAATELGLYVIIDWHILSDSNPLIHIEEAKDFWSKMVDKYHSYGNVFYEICNEPNVDCTWSDIKKYAETIIPIIREKDPYGVILIGTPCWSQKVNEAHADPVKGYSDLMYVLHFYADTHKEDLRAVFEEAASKSFPLFVSEFGICDASGNGNNNVEEALKWFALMDRYQVSYLMWNISNRDEASASFVPECDKVTDFEEADLREAAKWYIEQLKK